MLTPKVSRCAISLLLISIYPSLAWAANCADSYESTRFDYLGRNPANTKSYWLTLSNRADSFRLSAPGTGSIDEWQTAGPSVHISESTLVSDNNLQSLHKIDRMTPDGKFDCFLQSHYQVDPLVPPTWRPPAIPERPVVIRPEIPERPIVIRPVIPDRPVAIKPEFPDLPVVIRPEIPDRPIVIRPVIPDRPIAIKPELPDLPVVIRPEIPDRPIVIRPVIPDRPIAIKPELPDLPVVIRPEIPDRPIVIRPVIPDRPIAIKPELPDLPVVIRPEIPDRPIVIRPVIPDRPIAIKPELPDLPVVTRPEIPELPVVGRPEIPELPEVSRPKPEKPVLISLNGAQYELAQAQLLQLCPAAQLDEQGQVLSESLQNCQALIDALQQAPLTPGRDLVAANNWNSWADVQYLRSDNRRGFSPIEGRSATLSLGADRIVQDNFALGMMLTLSDQNSDSFSGNLQSESDQLMLGPYFAYGFNRNWSLFGNALLGRVERDYRLLALNGENSPMKYSASLNLQGEYALNPESVVRPKLGINYNYESGDDYQLTGSLLGKQLIIAVDSHHRDSGQMQASAEFNTKLKNQQGQLFVPYFETGVFYNYLNNNDDLSPRWQGLARAGLRTLASKALQIDVNASYQSIGVNNMDVWDCKLFIAYSF
ncbi:autotransporter domain-containing protein [Chitinibacter sp. SCUT-21]|uniref:autotransporter domain-containing protein n=1 Tax=Chitinibacter sp. SCUT-21 TaxID=2970891 RepID=UPI0035A6E2DA